MIYVYSLPLTTKTYIKTYVAKITNSHPKYVFEREFLKKIIIDNEGKRFYSYNIGEHGVFEQSTKVFLRGSHKLVSSDRKYFVYSCKKLSEIKRKEVMNYLSNLNLHYQKKLRRRKVS